MNPISITVSGSRERVLERLKAARDANISGTGHPLSDEGHSVFRVFQDYVEKIPEGSQVSLTIHAMCNYTAPPSGQPNTVGA